MGSFKKLIVFVTFVYSVAVGAVNDQYAFSNAIEQEQFNSLIQELRCVTCQNQNLAESNAPMAQTMRDEVYAQVKSGNTELQIKQFLVERYGDFVLYKPKVQVNTLALWFGPFCLLFIMVFIFVRKHLKASNLFNSMSKHRA